MARGCLIPCSPRPRVQSPPLVPLRRCPHREVVSPSPGSLMCRCPFVSRFICLSSYLSSCRPFVFSHSFSLLFLYVVSIPLSLFAFLGLFLPDRSLFSLFLFPRFGPPSRWGLSDRIMVENCPVPVRPQSDELNYKSMVVKAFTVYRTLWSRMSLTRKH